MAHRIYSDDELRAVLASYTLGTPVDPGAAVIIMATLPYVLRDRDEARARCVELLGCGQDARKGRFPEELQTAHDELKAAVAEPHGPDVDHVVDAALALLAYVERLPRPVRGRA